MAKFRLPPELGSGEIEIAVNTRDDARPTHWSWNIDGHAVSLPLAILTEIPPPIPPEPEPGAYLIGGVLCVRFEDGWDDDGEAAQAWEEAWQKHGGPDVDIVALVPKPAAVELPWKGESWSVWRDHPGRVQINVPGSSGVWSVPDDLAREFGLALLSAADRAEAGE